jgi:hypothetical protein
MNLNFQAGPEVCESYLTLKSGSKRLLILLRQEKQYLCPDSVEFVSCYNVTSAK